LPVLRETARGPWVNNSCSEITGIYCLSERTPAYSINSDFYVQEAVMNLNDQAGTPEWVRYNYLESVIGMPPTIQDQTIWVIRIFRGGHTFPWQLLMSQLYHLDERYA
jgi:hypothetical protein